MRFRWLLAGLLAGILCGCGGDSRRAETAGDVAAIRAVSDARAEAFRRGDAAGIAIHFTDDGLLMAPGSPAQRGREAVRAYYQSLFDAYEAGLESGYEEVEVSGDLAVGRGFAKVTLRPRTGGPTTVSTAKYLNVLRRQPNGGWLTTHDIWNGNEPEK
jgi:uncharacterized protein (TIGR02246 family)